MPSASPAHSARSGTGSSRAARAALAGSPLGHRAMHACASSAPAESSASVVDAVAPTATIARVSAPKAPLRYDVAAHASLASRSAGHWAAPPRSSGTNATHSHESATLPASAQRASSSGRGAASRMRIAREWLPARVFMLNDAQYPTPAPCKPSAYRTCPESSQSSSR